ncbi:MAG: enoyl-CoA hydratase/isomerase family protein [Hyphomonadaceae bacterium]|jgi:enoyl-CoA hydratase|nr:enoyl-CoA hydratase/isomerase family protein [Hyphomonadaceae bacterium]
MAEIIIHRQGVAGRITLNRPQALHALNEEMCLAMDAALKTWATDPEIELVVVDHAKDTRGFCAGGDIRMLAESGAADGSAAQAFFRAEYRLNTRIKNFPKPYVAFMDGVTMGGGVGISVHGSHRVATERTLFAMPETGIGLFPDVGGGWFLPRLGPPLGMWLALTGERLKGGDVCSAGIATNFCESKVVEAVKASACEGELGLLEAMDWDESAAFEKHLDTMQRTFWKPSVEEIFAALADEPDEWSAKQLVTLKTKSPRTLKIAHRQLSLGLQMQSFEDNMQMEYRIGSRQVHSHDFQEGVRAVIVDKDNAPKWNPAALNDVTDRDLDAVFAPLGDDELTFD